MVRTRGKCEFYAPLHHFAPLISSSLYLGVYLLVKYLIATAFLYYIDPVVSRNDGGNDDVGLIIGIIVVVLILATVIIILGVYYWRFKSTYVYVTVTVYSTHTIIYSIYNHKHR